MYLSRTTDWIAQYMQHPCSANDSHKVSSTAISCELFRRQWISFSNVSAYLSSWCISLWTGHSRNRHTSKRWFPTTFSVVPTWKPHQIEKKTQREYCPESQVPNRQSCFTQKCLGKTNYSTLFMCVLSCWLLSCHALLGAEGKPVVGLRESQRVYQDPRYAGAAYPPRVLMPPLDLGFRGQIAPEENQAKPNNLANLASNYQSDESAGNRWNSEMYQYGERQQQSQQGYGRFTGERSRLDMSQRQPGQPIQYPYSNEYVQSQWTSNNGYDPRQYPVQYLHSRDQASMTNSVAQPMTQYDDGARARYSPMGPVQQSPSQRNVLYQPLYPMYNENIENINGPARFASNTPNRNPYINYGQPAVKPGSSAWFGGYNQQPLMPPYYPYGNMPLYPLPESLIDQHGSVQQKPTNVLGHSSNYDVISEEEIERRLKEYNEYLESRGQNKEQ